MTGQLEDFLTYISAQRRYSKYTSRNYKNAIELWLGFLEERGIGVGGATRRDARKYVMWLSGKFDAATVRNKISAVRSFYKFLMKTYDAQSDPFSGVKLPKRKLDLPVFLTQNQVPRLLEAPWEDERNNEQDEITTVRDALCLELLYGAGLRISELCALKWGDIDFSRNAANILGKGNKRRFCPFGPNAGALLRRWRDEFALAKGDGDFVLYTPRKKPMYPRYIQRELSKYLAQTHLPSDITPHKLRHSFATHLVNAGVDLRALQEMLGHSSLSTTQIYTHLNMRKLVAEHNATHPRAR